MLATLPLHRLSTLLVCACSISFGPAVRFGSRLKTPAPLFGCWFAWSFGCLAVFGWPCWRFVLVGGVLVSGTPPRGGCLDQQPPRSPLARQKAGPGPGEGGGFVGQVVDSLAGFAAVLAACWVAWSSSVSSVSLALWWAVVSVSVVGLGGCGCVGLWWGQRASGR